MYKKQIAVVVIVFAVMGYLYSLPVKGIVKHKEADGHSNAATAAKPARQVTTLTVEMASETAKAAIGSALSAQISDTENQLKNAAGDAKLSLEKKLAKQWDDVNQPAPAAFYYQAVAGTENTFDDWVEAGTRYNSAFKFSQDTAAQPTFVNNAIACFRNATKLNPGDLNAKTGLGIAYVNQTSLGMTDPDGGSPMQGIMLLLDVVKQDPNNHSANLSLGMFAMKSGQFDKAVKRFKTIIAQQKQPDVEPYFYLAESYKQLGMKKEAIEAYQKCKELQPDAVFVQRIDQYIKELKN
jgi:tetratricopeptide (TPR) repeat protein